MSINIRIQSVIKELYSGNKRAFSIAVGVSPTVVENIVGKRQGNPSFEVTNKILESHPQLSPDWVLMGKGSMLKNGGYAIDENVSQVSEKEVAYGLNHKNEPPCIPLYRLDNVTDYSVLFKNQFNTKNKSGELSLPNAPKCDASIYVRGDGMYPALNAGDIVCYKILNNTDSILWGEMYLVYMDLNGEEFLTIKYICKSNLGHDFLLLTSHNPNHQPIDTPRSSIKGLALIKICIRYNSMG